jgi:DNA-binding response OmpR family regulator
VIRKRKSTAVGETVAEATEAVAPQGAPLALCPVPARVLIVGGTPLRRALIERVSPVSIRATGASDVAEASRAMSEGTYDLAIVIADDWDWREAVAQLTTEAPETAVLLMASEPGLALALEAMQAGAADLLAASVGTDELTTRLRAGLQRARRSQQGVERVERLRKLCKQLNSARQEVSKQVGSLCSDMASAYQELTDRMTHLATASEFNGLIRQELDLESLLRVALEYVLAKVGPTNAAVFLPATSGDYTLGAYVNYDSPRETAEVLLDHLAGVIAPRFETATSLIHIASRKELDRALGDRAEWIGDSELIVMPCHHDGECLAVVALFRDRHSPFPEGLRPLLQCVADQFGRQLARVIHVHHRHLPKHKWGSPGDTGEPESGGDDIDMAA